MDCRHAPPHPSRFNSFFFFFFGKGIWVFLKTVLHCFLRQTHWGQPMTLNSLLSTGLSVAGLQRRVRSCGELVNDGCALVQCEVGCECHGRGAECYTYEQESFSYWIQVGFRLGWRVG